MARRSIYKDNQLKCVTSKFVKKKPLLSQEFNYY